MKMISGHYTQHITEKTHRDLYERSIKSGCRINDESKKVVTFLTTEEPPTELAAKYRKALNTHKRGVHAESTHICDICNKGFTRKFTLEQHKASVHEKIKKC